MAEIKREPTVGADGDSITFDRDHTHSDILRYVINDVGPEHAGCLMQTLMEDTPIAVHIPLTLPKTGPQRPTPPKARLVTEGANPWDISSEAKIREKS